ncbi:MAG: DUF4131 domain-containing protein [Caldilineaceae bacterium SB0670_bin_27]|uniref:DUF4131 domain-containing protein n=1 Tax=Caldilineaceae bacterium SB0664_bin_27 TaxID=2605260 RepID=A0A6B0YMS9_9CHLR|nr:DUF4131 domain-containing protein [Caldilineaceae bacterium SB0664_bin_27]MYJ78847.1 DUF4131 domain-containing protein [Caldilineaceae bacterium SB0670_bin_27]
MKLLYLAIAYLAGVASGQMLWQQGWFGCGIGDHFWMAALALIPVCLWRDAVDVPRATAPMVWPAAAGFVPPRRTPSAWLVGGILLAGICGVLRLGSHPPQPCLGPSDLAYYNGIGNGRDGGSRPAAVDGYVASYPVLKEGWRRLDIEAEYLELEGERIGVDGRLRLQTNSVHRFRYGEGVRARGELTEPPVFEGFDYRAYLARKDIHSLMRRVRVEPQPGRLRGTFPLQFVYGLRSRGERLLNRLLPEPYAALANGMLLGIEAGIPDELYEKFNLTGASHVIVISGSNVALVTGALMALGIRLFGKRGALWPTLGGLALYTVLVGGDAAVMRAALMGGLFVVATVLGRQSTALVSLAAACWAMTLWNPLMLWDVGFQLSSAATVGLILIGPALTDSVTSLWRRLERGLLRKGRAADGSQADFLMPRSFGDLLRDSLLMTVAASVTTYPLIVHYFGRLSLISLFTNVLIAPAQPWIMIFGGMGLIAGLSGLEQVAYYLLFVPYASLWWTTMIVKWHATIQGGSVEVAAYGGGAMALTYAAILGLYWRKSIAGQVKCATASLFERLGRSGHRAARFSAVEQRETAAGRRLTVLAGATPTWTVGLLAVAAGLLWWLALTQPDGQLHVYFLDVGQGDGIFIQTPSGRQVLIDGGDDGQQLFAELGAVMPFWDRHIDRAIVTHPDWDHIGGQVDLPSRFGLGQAIISENVRDHEDSQLWLAALEAENVPVAGLQQGAWLDLGDGVALWALWPPREKFLTGLEENDKNERSLVLKLVYGSFSVLLTGDAGLSSEAQLLREGQPVAAHVLKVGHHGSEHSSSPAFVEAVGPSVAVIQVGAENRYGHPDPEVLEVLDGRLVLRNDRAGRVHIWSDGRLMWVATEKGDGAELLEWGGASGLIPARDKTD